jgi:hypothetical protein
MRLGTSLGAAIQAWHLQEPGPYAGDSTIAEARGDGLRVFAIHGRIFRIEVLRDLVGQFKTTAGRQLTNAASVVAAYGNCRPHTGKSPGLNYDNFAEGITVHVDADDAIQWVGVYTPERPWPNWKPKGR